MEKRRSELESSRDIVSANQTATLFISEEGRYLASVIGDPLIMGLKEIIKERPQSPVKFLANFLLQYEQSNNKHSAQIENQSPNLTDNNSNISAQKNSEARDKTVTISSKRKPIADHLISGPKAVTDNLVNAATAVGHLANGAITDHDPRVDNIVEREDDNKETEETGKQDKDERENEHDGKVNENRPNSGKHSGDNQPEMDTVKPDKNSPKNGLNTAEETPEKEPTQKTPESKEDLESSRNSEPDSDDDVDGKTSFKNVNRDDHGQSPIHFAASRSQGRNALSQILEELDANIAYRDELYRTARDLAEANGLHSNVVAIDWHVFQMGARGETEKLLDLLLEGYEHILDLDIEEDIVQEVITRGHAMTLSLLQSIPTFEERREKLHRAIRLGSDSIVREMLNKEAKDAKLLAVGKNNRGRCCLHIAVLSPHENIVKIIAAQFPLTLNIGDNLERTSLHYAMGVPQVESLSAILIGAGAQRTIKDLKGRTASYYFMNKSAIRALQEEESMLRV
uniref:Uncharacterized protein n=1 Tax=Cacopsylla melanoneura TaxID=428564 RepID=A0A8D8X640_9HEMI